MFGFDWQDFWAEVLGRAQAEEGSSARRERGREESPPLAGKGVEDEKEVHALKEHIKRLQQENLKLKGINASLYDFAAKELVKKWEDTFFKD